MTHTPAWQVHFATPVNALSYTHVVLSVALACAYSSHVTNPNGTARTWSFRNTIGPTVPFAAAGAAIRCGWRSRTPCRR